jgi:hypothetical protein
MVPYLQWCVRTLGLANSTILQFSNFLSSLKTTMMMMMSTTMSYVPHYENLSSMSSMPKLTGMRKTFSITFLATQFSQF